MIELPRVYNNNMVYSNTPNSQVVEPRAISDTTKHEMNERERRRQQNRRRSRSESKSSIDRRLPQDRRKPNFEAKA